MKIRIGPWDRKWSLMVRRRDNFTCQVEGCGYYSEHYTAAHHIIRRGVKSTRLEPLNGITLCPSHHVFDHKFSAHKTPEAFKRWFKKRFSLRWELIKRLERKHMTERDAVREFQELLKENK